MLNKVAGIIKTIGIILTIWLLLSFFEIILENKTPNPKYGSFNIIASTIMILK